MKDSKGCIVLERKGDALKITFDCFISLGKVRGGGAPSHLLRGEISNTLPYQDLPKIGLVKSFMLIYRSVTTVPSEHQNKMRSQIWLRPPGYLTKRAPLGLSTHGSHFQLGSSVTHHHQNLLKQLTSLIAKVTNKKGFLV